MRQGGECIRKRSEASLTRACLDYLRLLENSKRIAWYQRMNSGAIRSGKYFIKLCRAGTADLVIRLLNGHTIWAEAKLPGFSPTDIQQEFRAKMESLGDSYIVIHSLEELRGALDSIFIRQAQV
jgi:hypothetical protein